MDTLRWQAKGRGSQVGLKNGPGHGGHLQWNAIQPNKHKHRHDDIATGENPDVADPLFAAPHLEGLTPVMFHRPFKKPGK